MLRSMTAYGRASTETDVGLIGVEILSVNRKHLDVQLQIPKVLTCLEVEVRKWISKAVKRGQVSVRITPKFKDGEFVKVTPNLPLARQLHHAWKEIGVDLGLGDEFALSLLRHETGLLIHDDEISDIEVFKKCIEDAVMQALKPFIQMKEHEGRVIAADFLKRIQRLGEMIAVVEEKMVGATTRFREKLVTTLTDALPQAIALEERVLQEACIYAEKVDIEEEITRFKSHLDQMRETIEGSESVVGKRMEFLLQELGREVNTVGSKSADLEVSRLVVDMKTELERIREQVQNVE